MPDEIDLTEEEDCALNQANDQVGLQNSLDYLAGQAVANRGLTKNAKESRAWLRGYDDERRLS